MKKKMLKYIIGILITLLALYMLIPFKLSCRTHLDSNSISRIWISRMYFDTEWKNDSIEINNKDEINEFVSLLQGTHSMFSFKSVTEYNRFSYDGSTDGYTIYLIVDERGESRNVFLTNKHLKVNGRINITYRVFHSIGEYEKYFTD